jgi:hypothetical protein
LYQKDLRFVWKKGFWPHLHPWGAQYLDVFIESFHKDKKILIFIVKAIMEDNGTDYIAGSTAQDKGGITG